MSPNLSSIARWRGLEKRFGLIKFASAVIIYFAFAIYLYRPYFRSFSAIQCLVIVNTSLAALGCYVLSRRWVVAFLGSVFAGLVYGFGPFALWLGKFHLTAGLLAATIPWLFLPAAFGPKGRWRWLRFIFCALPFLGILVFFQVGAYYRLFAIPTQTQFRLADLAGLLAPLAMAEYSVTLIGFYHVPMAPLAMGFCILLAARRLGVMIVFCSGIILAFCNVLFNISPSIWLVFPVLCCAILIGEGMQAIVSASRSDRRWLLAAAIIMLALAVAALLLSSKYYQLFAGLGAESARLIVEAAKMYLLGAVGVGVIFFLASAKLRLLPLRWAILSSAMALDIILGARFIADKIF